MGKWFGVLPFAVLAVSGLTLALSFAFAEMTADLGVNFGAAALFMMSGVGFLVGLAAFAASYSKPLSDGWRTFCLLTIAVLIAATAFIGLVSFFRWF